MEIIIDEKDIRSHIQSILIHWSNRHDLPADNPSDYDYCIKNSALVAQMEGKENDFYNGSMFLLKNKSVNLEYFTGDIMLLDVGQIRVLLERVVTVMPNFVSGLYPSENVTIVSSVDRNWRIPTISRRTS